MYPGKGRVSPMLRALQAPEGPHIYHKDGYYYLLAAEGKQVEPLSLGDLDAKIT